MAIVHSCVSLPEGTSLESGVSENAAPLKHLCLSWSSLLNCKFRGAKYANYVPTISPSFSAIQLYIDREKIHYIPINILTLSHDIPLHPHIYIYIYSIYIYICIHICSIYIYMPNSSTIFHLNMYPNIRMSCISPFFFERRGGVLVSNALAEAKYLQRGGLSSHALEVPYLSTTI